MANNDTAYPILNPHTALAFLPPDIANQYEAVGYLYIASLAVSPPISGWTSVTNSHPAAVGVHMGLAASIARGVPVVSTRGTEPS